MSKEQIRNGSQDPLSDNNPPSEKASQGDPPLVSWRRLTSKLSDGLDFNPPNPNSSDTSENNGRPDFSWIEEADSKDPYWLREYIKERLEIDALSPNPSKGNHNFPHDNGQDEILPVNQALFEISEGDVDSSHIIPALKVNSGDKKPVTDPPAQLGGNGKSDVTPADMQSGFEKPSDSQIDSEVAPIYRGNEQASPSPLAKPQKKASWVLASIPLFLVIALGAWSSRNLAFGQYTNLETEEAAAYTQSMLPTTLANNDVLSPDEINSMSTALQSTVSQTPTPEPSKYDGSMLTQVQKDRLYRASLTYLADDNEEAVFVARNIEYVPNEGHPATMCGPLAMSILRDAMLVDRYINVGDFWLLNPREDYAVRAILEKYFPREYYHWYQTTIPVNYYDFKSHPLYTGDFLYLFAGRGGTFEHMLVVTRVDDMGRAYSVFALEDSAGYSIEEVMLYDPNNPGEGYFYEITDSANAEFGITGLGGFWMWRRITPFPEVNFDDLAFSNRLDSVLNETGGEWHAYIKEVDGRVIYSRESQELINPASIIKVPLAIQFFEALDYQQETDITEYLSTHGVKGRTYMQLLSAMLVDSEEDATELLSDWIDDRIHIKDSFARWGTLETTYTPRRTTAEEISNIFEGLYNGLWLLPEERQIILDLMGEYSPGDNTRLGLINEYLPEDYNLYNKRGSVAKGFVVVADVAIIDMGNRAYVVALFGYPEPGGKLPTYDDLEATIEETVPLIWYYLNQ